MSNQLLDKSHFKLYANCIPVKGASRSIICDIQRGRYNFITNDLYEILSEQSDLSINDIFSFYGAENKEILEEYFHFLSSEEYIFFCEFEELGLFPKLDLHWESPSIITNAIIDVGIDSNHNFPDIFIQLEDLGCKALQLRFFTETTLNEVSEILAFTESSSITSLEVIIPYPIKVTTKQEYISFASSNLRLSLVIFHSAPQNSVLENESLPCTYILFTEDQINDESHCGVISKSYFTLNIESFSEAQLFNSCLNRKISIDKSGNIKNCPSMSLSYGNIKFQTLKEVIRMKEFKKVWSINKNQINICKDCEFRYICTDCRAFISTIDVLSKPAKCNYNPYLETWEEK
ncbi:SPASM domain peptide maturase of grasp-with-spasm system [Pedobacter cryoconitis]|uniref:SPASM domain peptide maturase of grasp-with-spasm system n=1 Tax=Pedobacter cryoconitis TaxID=188932 RepID=A0A7W8YXE3_9SPHI|nr:grasp-with-spasm system SPASM domain peptide maturase [Pedobacter cryoconitis]MBB5623581.1 SPASM domain peptide maturase of grasp-with-spasm system [Pedobacter cryoconitis]